MAVVTLDATTAPTTVTPGPPQRPQSPTGHRLLDPARLLAAGNRWRLLPGLAEDEAQLLRASVAARGVVTPVVVDAATGELVDGFARTRICAELHLPCPAEARAFSSDDDRVRFILEANLARRHLTIDQRRGLVRWLCGDLRWSGRRVAESLRCAQATVSRDLGSIAASDPSFRLPEASEGRTRRLRDGRVVPYARRQLGASQRPSGRMIEGRAGRAWLPDDAEGVARLQRTMTAELVAWVRFHALHVMGVPELRHRFSEVIAAIGALPAGAGRGRSVRRAPC